MQKMQWPSPDWCHRVAAASSKADNNFPWPNMHSTTPMNEAGTRERLLLDQQWLDAIMPGSSSGRNRGVRRSGHPLAERPLLVRLFRRVPDMGLVGNPTVQPPLRSPRSPGPGNVPTAGIPSKSRRPCVPDADPLLSPECAGLSQSLPRTIRGRPVPPIDEFEVHDGKRRRSWTRSSGNCEQMKTDPPECEADRPSEDDRARAALGGPRGSKDLKPAKMTRRQKQDMPPERGYDPGHTA